MEAGRLRRGDTGQAAMVDAILFMTVMLLATAVVLGSAPRAQPGNPGMQAYASEFAGTLLRAELAGMQYTDATGRPVRLGEAGRGIGQLLCDQTAILARSPGCDFSGYEARILAAGRHLLRPGLDFAISCNGGAVFISESLGGISDLPAERSASQLTVRSGGASDFPVTITVYVWVV